jgi:putative ABC transport system substrate-binding protein
MRRREFLALVCGAVAVWPTAAGAQQAGRIYRIGFLWDSPAVQPDLLEGFRQGLRELGWIEGQNIIVEYRWAEGRFDRLRELADELVQLKVDAIVAPTSIYAEAAKRTTSTIPIVFVNHADPLGSGHVESLARPGRNLTGLSFMMGEINTKGLELLKEAVPGLSRVAVLWNPATPSHGPILNAVETASQALGIRLQPVAVRSPTEFDSAFLAMTGEHADGVLVLATPLLYSERLAELALRHRLPSVFVPRAQVEAGGLLSYGPDRPDLFRRAAGYVDKVLKGASPADLPVQQPTKLELVVNLKTAKAIGIEVSPSIILRADEVIE